MQGHLAYVIIREQDVPCCQVSVDKGLAGQIGHSRGHLSTVAQEGVVIYADCIRFESHEVVLEVSFWEYFKNNQHLISCCTYM